LDSDISIRRGDSDIVVECEFDKTDSVAAKFGNPSSAFCFGVLTSSPPLTLSLCSSVPSEFNLENAFEFSLDQYTDLEGQKSGKKKRKKREETRLAIKVFNTFSRF
jgi:hypothetical protein